MVVYQTQVGQMPPFLTGSQKPSLNWNGTENKAYAAYSRALHDASDQLVSTLNARCAA